jgi:hypothetical protein
MRQLIQHIIPSLRIIEIAGHSSKFEQWLKEYHNKELTDDLLAGYKFFIECAFSEFFYGVSVEDEFKIDTDFLLNRAIIEATYPLDKLPHKENCERIPPLGSPDLTTCENRWFFCI